MVRQLAKAMMFATVGVAFGGSAWAGDPIEGQRLAAQWCDECHLIGPDDRDAIAGVPSFQELAKDDNKSLDYFGAFLLNPHPPMPPLTLSRQEIDDLVEYIGTLK